ncbi:hypothetical protein [Marinivivus vitaminiproducens]|uniref:hypothetical protein n=1 Tax=Marinivivus vitaminiproducens TaxID=3035935 RepID=UPI00279B5E08|nr:hypothetical protein P4R82_14355 [Geminicoccaceae bacterium SCSIO 64248]
MNPTFEELSFVAVAIASAITGLVGAARARRSPPADAAPPDPAYDRGRWHEQERQDRVMQAARLHHDLERLERSLDRQTQVLERALDRLPALIARARDRHDA